MPKEDNLRPIQLSHDEAVEYGRRGGKTRGENIKRRKALKELLEIGLQMTDKETGEQNDFVITMAQIEKAKKGDTSAYAIIRDTIGEKPTDKQEITGKNGEPLGVVKEYILPEEVKSFEEHYKKAIEEK